MIRNHPLALVIAILLLFVTCNNVVMGQDAEANEPPPASPDFELYGFIQQQFLSEQNTSSPNRFSVARARLGLTRDVTDRLSFNLLGGLTEPPNDTPQLVNAFIDYEIHPLLTLRAGQFLLPFGLEGPEAIFANPAIERSQSILRMNDFALARDIGLQAFGGHSGFTYAVAVVNGMGANRNEQIDPKDVMGRVSFAFTDELTAGVSGHMGQYRPDPTSAEEESRYRAGIDLSFGTGPVLIRGEYQYKQNNLTLADDMQMHGGYILTAYELSDTWEVIGRYDYFNPDISLNEDHLTILTTGLNYYFTGHNRLSVNYEFRNNRMLPGMGDLLTVQMQVVF